MLEKKLGELNRDVLRRIFLYIAYKVEGQGYDPEDPAGETIYGITKKWYPEFYEKLKTALENNNKKELETAIFNSYSEIYKKSLSEYLPYPLNVTHFDFYFNAGDHSFEALQKLLKHFGRYLGKIDGIFGKHSKKALDIFLKEDYDFNNKFFYYSLYNYFRRNFYLDNPEKRYIIGWINRVQKIDKLCLTEL